MDDVVNPMPTFPIPLPTRKRISKGGVSIIAGRGSQQNVQGTQETESHVNHSGLARRGEPQPNEENLQEIKSIGIVHIESSDSEDIEY
jgi:hypothetical protein